MILKSELEVANTRHKLQILQEEYRAAQMDRDEAPRLRQLTMRSLKRLIVQLQEEILRYEACQVAHR